MNDIKEPTTLNGYDAKKVIELMLLPLPDVAYTSHPKTFLTSISADYTRERLTKIFGLFGLGWGLIWEPENTRDWVSQTAGGKDRYHFAILQAVFWFKFGDDIISFQVTGHSDNDNLGDAMSGARTRCISDGAKQLLFQLHIFKGVPYQPPNNESNGNSPHIDQSTGEVITSEQVAGFDNKPTKKEFTFPSKAARDFFDAMEKFTNNYWENNGWHFSKTMEKLNLNWSILNSQNDIEEAIQKLKLYANNRRDEKAASEEK